MKHLYMGDGKGKTTAALGLVMRSAGAEHRVLFTQFMKGQNGSELEILSEMDGVQLYLYPEEIGPVSYMSAKDRENAKAAYEEYIWGITRILLQSSFDMLVMDEVVTAIHEGVLDEDYLMEMCLSQLPDDMEIVLTGHDPSQAMTDWADYVTEMRKIKHPADQGIRARKGIEL